jgi:hypothetical protein
MTIRRLKTYAGSQGYVYQYYFVGKRPKPGRDATEYIFDVTSDRKTAYAISVVLETEVVTAWAAAHGRSLSDTERYAAVKMRLFRAFDELENVRETEGELTIDLPTLEELLAALGVE